MKGSTNAKVLIVGAGPVGLATAITLNKRNIPVAVIERDDRPGTHSYALAMHPGTLAKLRDWGLSEDLEKSGLPVEWLRFCDAKDNSFDLELSKINSSQKGLLVVGQDHLEEALVSPLEKAGVPILWNHRLASLEQDDHTVKLKLERLSEGMSGYAMARLEWQVDKEFSDQAQFVVGADGHLSMVRRQLGIDFPKVADTQSFAVFEFKTDFNHRNAASVVFGDDGTSILWPLPGGYCRWGFEIGKSMAEQFTRDKDRLFVQVGSQGYQALETDMLKTLIAERAPWFDGSIGAFRWRMIVRFEKRLVDSFGKGRVWLAGDASHLAAPIGMQSMNIGILEGCKLGSRIADIIDGKSDLDSLEEYGEDRLREWKALLGMEASLSSTDTTSDLIKANIDQMLDCIPGSLESLPAFAEAMGLTLKSK